MGTSGYHFHKMTYQIQLMGTLAKMVRAVPHGLGPGSAAGRRASSVYTRLGEGAEDILSSTNISEADRKKFSAALSKLRRVLPGAEECDI